jgi:hypothetical protein
MKRLMDAVRIFMEIAAPFPGSQPHLAKVKNGQEYGSAI